MENAVTIIDPKEYGLEEQQANEIQLGLNVFIEERKLLIEEFNVVSKLEVNKENIKIFKDLRLRIVKNRTQGIEKWHKTSKEYFLRGGQFVDAKKRKESLINESMEDVLLDGEKFFDNIEAERIKSLHAERSEKLTPFGYEIGATNFGLMDDNMFNAILVGAEKTHNDKVEAEKKAQEELEEANRIKNLTECRKQLLFDNWRFLTDEETNIKFGEMEAEKYEALRKRINDQAIEEQKEQAKIKAENEKLKAENERKEKEAKELKAKADAELAEQKRIADIEAKKQADIIAAQKLESDKLAAELKAKADAEAKEKQRLIDEENKRIAEEKKAAKQPDKEKLRSVAMQVNELKNILPEMKTEEGKKVLESIKGLLDKVIFYTKEQTEKL